MKDTKLVQLLQILKKKEFEKLRKYVRGPYITENASVIQLYDYLALYYPTFASSALDKEKVFQQLFPSHTYDDVKLRHLRSKLLKIVEQYLIQLYFEGENFEKQRLLTKIYGQRNHLPAFERRSQKLLADLKNQSTQHPTLLLHGYSLSEEIYFHQLTINTKQTDRLLQAIDYLEQFYFLERTKLLVEIRSRERIFNEKFNTPLIPKYAAKPSSIYQSLLWQVAELLADYDEALYFSTKQYLYKNYQLLSKEHNQLALRILSNFLIHKMRIDEDKWIPENLKLINWGIDSGIVLVNNIISEVTYLNYIVFCIKIRDFDACHKFQTAYQDLLQENIRDDIVAFADSFILFHKEEYDVVIQKMTTLKINSTNISINARTLLLQAYYHLVAAGDLTYMKPLIAGCDAFKTLLGRSHLSQEKKLTYLNFVIILKKMVKHYFKKKNQVKLNKIIQEIDARKYLAGKKWLKDRIKEQED